MPCAGTVDIPCKGESTTQLSYADKAAKCAGDGHGWQADVWQLKSLINAQLFVSFWKHVISGMAVDCPCEFDLHALAYTPPPYHDPYAFTIVSQHHHAIAQCPQHKIPTTAA